MTVQAHPPPAQQPDSDPGALALCLSGGGLRATLFHLGLIRALRQSTVNGQMALKAVREVYAVSGGSILAGHFLANYSSYVSEDDSKFEMVAKKLLAFADRDLRNRVLRRWPFRPLLQNPRGRLLQREYHDFLAKRTIGQCYAGTVDLPTFHFLCTSFTTGELCSFSRTCFEQIDLSSASDPPSTKADGLPLAFAVAASSAFPPMFPPMQLTPDDLGTGGKPPFNSPIALSDGGVFDNFGIDRYRRAKRAGPRPGLVIVSNAGGSFATDPEHSYDSMLSRNIRASDILMRRVADNTLEAGQGFAGKGLVLVRIGATVPDPEIAETTQQRFRTIRTDLDRFDAKLADLLVGHGERVARQALADHRWNDDAPATFSVNPRSASPSSDGNDAPSADQTIKLDRILSAAARGRWRPLFFDFRDIGYLILWWVIGTLLLAGILALLYTAILYEKAQSEKITAMNLSSAAQQAKIAAMDQQLRVSNINEAKLEQVRQAAETGDLQQIRRSLALAIDTSEDLAENVATSAQESSATVTPTEVSRIIETPSISPLPPAGHSQKVYIHFAGALTRAQITALNQALRKSGWNVDGPSGERLPAAASKAEVRYSGANLAAAQALADALNQSGLPIRSVSPKHNPDIGAGNLEAWISR